MSEHPPVHPDESVPDDLDVEQPDQTPAPDLDPEDD